MRFVGILGLMLCFACPAMAATQGMVVSHAWTLANPGEGASANVYLTIDNHGKPDSLVRVSTRAGKGHLYIDGAQAVQRVAIDRNIHLAGSPAGFHIMLTGLQRPLAEDYSFPITLTFAHHKKMIVTVEVRPLGRAPDEAVSLVDRQAG